MKNRVPGMVFIPLLIFLGISLYQTAIGFEDLLGPVLAWGFSAGVTVIMGYLTYNVGNRLLEHRKIAGLIVLFCFCFIFSFVGNFNAIYTNYQTEQLYRDELTLRKNELSELTSKADKALDNFSPDQSSKSSKVEQLRNQLFAQITDPARPGLGQRAEEIILQIEDLLDQKLTPLAGKTPLEIARNYDDNIKKIAEIKFNNGELGKAKLLRDQIDKRAQNYQNAIDGVLLKSSLVYKNASELNERSVNAINDMSSQVSGFIKDSDIFQFKTVHSGTQEIGKIAFSLQSALKHPVSAALFALICIFLDWAVMIYLIARYRDGADASQKVKPRPTDL